MGNQGELPASGKGVARLPNWALHEYRERDYVSVTSLSEDGIWPTLYTAVRTNQMDAPFMVGFIETTRNACFANLVGIVTAEPD